MASPASRWKGTRTRRLPRVLVGLVWIVGSCAVAAASDERFTGGGNGTFLQPAAADDIHLTLRVAKVGASTASGYTGVALYDAVGGETCDAFVVCEDPNPTNFVCSSGQIASQAALSAADLTAAIAAGLNGNCPSGTVAGAQGEVVTISSDVENLRACVFASEMGSEGGFAKGLNVGFAFPVDCTAQNVCDGVNANERSSDPVNGGFALEEEETVATVPLSPLAALVLAMTLLIVGVVVAGRRNSKCGTVRSHE